MNETKRVAGEFVQSVTVAEVLKSAGIQLALWSHDIAYTDAAFGADWAMETADRMATVSELLYDVYLQIDERTKAEHIALPRGVIGQIQINPMWDKPAEKPASDDAGDSDSVGGDKSTINDFPF
jgi:hypothetical protein